MSTRILTLTILAASFSFAGGPVDPINKTSKGIAVEGYDAVAYFTIGEPTKGSPEFTHQWHGATWQFANQGNLEAFKKEPEKYAPQYGGYCAYAVSKGSTAGISPKAWQVVNGKLYLNHRFAKGKFDKDVPGNIERADKNWPGIAKKPSKP